MDAVFISNRGRRLLGMGVALLLALGLLSGFPSQAFAVDEITPGSTPTITGTLRAGSTVSVAADSWEPVDLSLSYQWFRDGTPISGATSDTYELTNADVGGAILVDLA